MGEKDVSMLEAPVTLEWIRREEPFVSIDRFGKDHWSTFAYIETRTVDHNGVLEHDHMRCNEIRHPLMANAGKRGLFVGGKPGSAYATRLKKTTRVSGKFDSEELFDHDDYDCVNDLIAAGLLEVAMPAANSYGFYIDSRGRTIKYEGEQIHESFVTGLVEAHLAQWATFRLTDLGLGVASQLRAHKADGGNFHGFVPVI